MNKKIFLFMCGVDFGLIICKLQTTQMIGVDVPTWNVIMGILVLTLVLSFNKIWEILMFFITLSLIIDFTTQICMGNFKWWYVFFVIVYIISLYRSSFMLKNNNIFVEYGDITKFPPAFEK